MTTCTLIHYPVTSDNPWFDGSLIFYRGDDYFIEPHETVVLVPCKSVDPEHWKSSKNSCKLLTSSTFQQPENVLKRRFLAYLIANTTDVGLLLKHGDLLGPSYSGPHAEIRAVNCYLPWHYHNALIMGQLKMDSLQEYLHYEPPQLLLRQYRGDRKPQRLFLCSCQL
jgi:hypothetical protein